MGHQTHKARTSISRGQRWMSHESVDDSASNSDLSEAGLAHANVLSINHDLETRLDQLENSRSYRLGQMVSKTLRAMLFPLTWFSREVVESVEIEYAWPFLSGEIVLRRHSDSVLDVVVTAGSSQLLRASIDLRTATPKEQGNRYSVVFRLPYEITSEVFQFGLLRISIGDHHFRGADCRAHPSCQTNQCRPLDVVGESIIEVIGDPRQLREQLPNHAGVAILATFRDVYRQRDYSSSLIEDLKASNFLVVVVDTSPTSPSETSKCDLYIHRRNFGWDFASWISVLRRFPWLMSESRNLLLLNDSNVGSFVPISEIISRGLDLELDVWGITDSWEISYHLQSYFLFFKGNVLSDGHLGDFISSYPFPRSKNAIIEKGEIGLSAHLAGNGIRIGALFPYEFLCRRFLESLDDRIKGIQGKFTRHESLVQWLSPDYLEAQFIRSVEEQIQGAHPLNPTHYFWDELIRAGSPFIKRELLIRNPEHVPNLSSLIELADSERARRVLFDEVRLCRKSAPTFSLELALRNLSS